MLHPSTVYDFGTVGAVCNLGLALAIALWAWQLRTGSVSQRKYERANKFLICTLVYAWFCIFAAFPGFETLLALPVVVLTALQQTENRTYRS